MDELAAVVLEDQERQDLFLDAREAAGAADLSASWHDYMVDLHDLGVVLAGLDEAALAAQGAAIDQAMEEAVVAEAEAVAVAAEQRAEPPRARHRGGGSGQQEQKKQAATTAMTTHTKSTSCTRR